MGASEPLPVLVAHLTAAMTSPDASHPVTEMLVQNTILELASRKSYGAKDGASWCLLLHRCGRVVGTNQGLQSCTHLTFDQLGRCAFCSRSSP
jgi:hypothetical protein